LIFPGRLEPNLVSIYREPLKNPPFFIILTPPKNHFNIDFIGKWSKKGFPPKKSQKKGEIPSKIGCPPKKHEKKGGFLTFSQLNQYQTSKKTRAEKCTFIIKPDFNCGEKCRKNGQKMIEKGGF